MIRLAGKIEMEFQLAFILHGVLAYAFVPELEKIMPPLWQFREPKEE